MSQDFDSHLFQQVCKLEAKLDLEGSKRYELERLLKEAIMIVNRTGLTDYNTDWYLRTKRELGL
jgi:hypothetical protein